MVFVDGHFLRVLAQADLHRRVAAGAERAAGRQVQHVDRRARDRDKLLFHVVDVRDGAK